jgi:putative membrane protein
VGQNDLQIALIKYNKKTWCKSALLGFFVGLAIIVPGISGSTVAIIFKLYDQFLYALGNLLKKFKQCFLFLLPIGIGMVLGVLLGFIGVKSLLKILPFAIICLFAGLMVGAFPAVYDEVKTAKKTPLRIGLFVLGLAIPIAMGCISAVGTVNMQSVGAAVETATETAAPVLKTFENIGVGHVFASLALGVAMGLTQIVPGLSFSAVMMAVGWFADFIASISLTYWKSNPSIFLVYGAMGIGFIVSVLALSKVLTSLFERARHTSYSMIVGLSLGSILSMFCNGDIMEVYLSWSQGTATNPVVDIVLGVVLFVVGIIGAYLLVRYQKKQDEIAKTSANA